MIRVYPGATNPTHDLSLSDGVQTWGLRLDRGPESLKEEPLTPSTLRLAGPSSFGAWEPGLAQIEQRDWSGGRGLERFAAEDAAAARRFYDSQNAWTLTPGLLLPAPQWRLARGLRNAVQHLPGDVSWQGLLGPTRALAARFQVGATPLAPACARVWLRRVGSPDALFLSLLENDDGAPGAAVPDSTASVSIADVQDVISVFYAFDLANLETELAAGIHYHLALAASPLDNAANHWEIGVDTKGGGHASADGGLAYQHEAVLVAGTVDMGAARLPKFINEMSLLTRNLGGGVQVNLDYQLDAEIGGPRWRSGGAFYSSPLDSLPLRAGELHAIRTRLRLLTHRADLRPRWRGRCWKASRARR